MNAVRRLRRRFDEFWRGRDRSAVVAAALLVTLVLAVVDYATGYELSFSLFYVMPVAFVAWYAGRNSAGLVALASAAAWEEANRLAGQAYSSPAINVWNASIRLGFFLTIAILIVLLKQTLEREQALSRTDSLTGISNRRAFYEATEAELARAKRSARPLTVIYIDLDDFKLVNDRLGHEVGDQLLCAVAQCLRRGFRTTDTVARLGGDEFGVLLPDTNDAAAYALVEKTRSELGAQMRRNNWPVGISMGVLTCAAVPDSADVMVRLADGLMYEVKAGGKNAVRCSVYAG